MLKSSIIQSTWMMCWSKHVDFSWKSSFKQSKWLMCWRKHVNFTLKSLIKQSTWMMWSRKHVDFTCKSSIKQSKWLMWSSNHVDFTFVRVYFRQIMINFTRVDWFNWTLSWQNQTGSIYQHGFRSNDDLNGITWLNFQLMFDSSWRMNDVWISNSDHWMKYRWLEMWNYLENHWSQTSETIYHLEARNVKNLNLSSDLKDDEFERRNHEEQEIEEEDKRRSKNEKTKNYIFKPLHVSLFLIK